MNVVVIGGSSSIGSLVAKRFSTPDNQVIVTFHKNKIPSSNNMRTFALNLACEDSINTFCSHLKSEVKHIDIMIFLSAILPGKSLTDYHSSEIDNVMTVNFSGFSKLVAKTEPLFSNNALILVLTSISADRGSYDPVYAASKGALVSWVKSLSQYWAPKIRVNAVSPGLIKGSSMFEDMSSERRAYHLDATPMKALTEIEDLAAIIYDLTQPHWKNVNGEIIKVNGGSYV